MGLLYWDKARSLFYGEVENVTPNTWTTITEKTFSADILLTSIMCSGTIYAEFSIFKDGNKMATKRSSPDKNVTFTFHWPLFLTAGSKLEVKVIHYRLDESPAFEAGVFGFN